MCRNTISFAFPDARWWLCWVRRWLSSWGEGIIGHIAMSMKLRSWPTLANQGKNVHLCNSTLKTLLGLNPWEIYQSLPPTTLPSASPTSSLWPYFRESFELQTNYWFSPAKAIQDSCVNSHIWLLTIFQLNFARLLIQPITKYWDTTFRATLSHFSRCSDCPTTPKKHWEDSTAATEKKLYYSKVIKNYSQVHEE